MLTKECDSMPYGYTDEVWARIDSPTKYRIIQEAQKQAKPKTTTTTPKTTTTKTTSDPHKRTTANTGATTYNAPSQQTLDSMLGAIKAATQPQTFKDMERRESLNMAGE